MSAVLDKNVSLEKETCKKNPACKYVPCFFEKVLPKKYSGLSSTSRWNNMLNTAIIAYLSVLILYYGFTQIFSNSLHSVSVYNYAAPIVISIVFWPFIIIYDCELFHRLYIALRPLLKDKQQGDEWYCQTARCNFGFLCSKDSKSLIPVFLNCLSAVVIGMIFCFGLSGSLKFSVASEYAVLSAPFAFSVAVTYFSHKNGNLNMILTVVNGGLTYYTYILQYAKKPMPYLFNCDCYGLNVLLFAVVAVVFFIAGSTIMPMLGLFKAIYLDNIEQKIAYPMENIANSLNRINKIKRYFLHLTGITLLAYFQLFGSVYFLGILNRKSLVTIALFVLGSLFPLIMYLAANVFFKKLSHKVYSLQVENIDKLIDSEINANGINADKLQALVAVKQMYSEEFEIHIEINKEIFFTMLSPLATTVVALIFPFAS